MKLHKKVFATVLSVAMLVSSISGTNLGQMNVAKAAGKLSINKKKLTLTVGKKATLKIKNAGKKITWISNKKKVAKVSKKGVVTAVSAGKAKITAKTAGKKFTCTVTVKKKKPLNISNNYPDIEANMTPAPTDAAPTKTPDAEPSGKPDATPSDTPQEDPDAVKLEASKPSGTYNASFTLNLTSNQKDATIYYTTDGSDPSLSTNTRRIKYTEDGISINGRSGERNRLAAVDPYYFETQSNAGLSSHYKVPGDDAVDKCTVLRAVAVRADGKMSPVMTNTYFIGSMSRHISGISESAKAAGQKLSVISITMDYNDLFDNAKGIYVKGNHYIQGQERTGNFIQRGKEWERTCHIDYFESDGVNTSLELSQDCGIRIQGNYSRCALQKSFRLYAREEYGAKNFKYPFFSGLKSADGEEMDKFKTLVLRNGGNDWGNLKYKDIIMQSFLQDSPNETLTGRPCVVYLDGEYWGYYILQDDVSDNFLQERRGVDKDKVVLYKGQDADEQGRVYKLDEGELPEGQEDNLDYYLEDTLKYLDTHDLSQAGNYQTFIDKYMSEESAVDYYATMLYLHNRYDWPGKNWSIWRTTDDRRNEVAYEDGRWRFCIYDLDLTTNTTWTGNGLDGDSHRTDKVHEFASGEGYSIIMQFFKHMIKNESFRTKLKAQVKNLAQNVFTEAKVKQTGDKYLAIYSPLYQQFLERFGLWGDGESSHEGNVRWLKARISYADTLCQHIDEYQKSDSSSNASSEELALVDNKLIWKGIWERGDSNNQVTAKTPGFRYTSDDFNFMQIDIDTDIWKQYKNPVIKITMQDGYAENARAHLWNNTCGTYYYLKNVEDDHKADGVVKNWIGAELPLKDFNGSFCLNVQTGHGVITGFEIYDAK